MLIARMACRIAGVLIVGLALAGCGAQDRAQMEKASQENVSLKAQLNDLTREQESLKKELASATKERDQYQKQMGDANAAAKKMQDALGELRTAANGNLDKAKAELAVAKQSQADAEQTAVRLKAAEDAVTAVRAKAADAEKAASTASDRLTQMSAENAALKQKVDAMTAELAKKAAAPPADLNK